MKAVAALYQFRRRHLVVIDTPDAQDALGVYCFERFNDRRFLVMELQIDYHSPHESQHVVLLLYEMALHSEAFANL